MLVALGVVAAGQLPPAAAQPAALSPSVVLAATVAPTPTPVYPRPAPAPTYTRPTPPRTYAQPGPGYQYQAPGRAQQQLPHYARPVPAQPRQSPTYTPPTPRHTYSAPRVQPLQTPTRRSTVPAPTPRLILPTPVTPVPGPRVVSVPRVIGLGLGAAEQSLINNGLSIGSVSLAGSDAGTGTVVRTNPGAFSSVPLGTPVNIVLDAG
jgi:hypothetical protein